MTLPKVNNDLLIFIPSVLVLPSAFVFDILSLPAKSTNDSVPWVIVYYPPPIGF